MYEPFFGMERRPFSATPDPGCFYCSSELQAVLDELTVCVERSQGIGILTAAAGIGKTLLCQRLAANFRQRDESGSQFECVYLSNSNFPTRRSLLQAILFEMGDEYSRRDEPELRIDLRSRLLSLRPRREALVLIVDEAHLFADELLEELRTLSDIADNGSSLVRIILSGQHDLEERLTDRSFDALNQRLSNHVIVESLTISESVEYIAHRLAWAGCGVEPVFTEKAIAIITRASGGVPRCLNQLCDHSLLLAFASDQNPVSERTVREALEDLKQLPLHWNDVSDGTAIVGYMADDDEPSEELNAEIDDSSIDAELEAKLNKVASQGLVESHSTPASEAFSDESDIEADEPLGIEESLRAGILSTEPSTEAESHRPIVPPLLGGFEFDFSSDSNSEAIAGPDTDRSSLEDENSTPETSIFEFGSNETEDTHRVEEAREFEPVDLDETLIQVLLPAAQETAAHKTICEAAARSDRPATNDALHDESHASSDAGISFTISSSGLELDDFGPPEELDAQPSNVSMGTAEPAADAEADGSFAVDDKEHNSGVIEFSFSEESSAELMPVTSEPSDQEDDFGEPTRHTISAAEISQALFGQDSVLPEHKSDFVVPTNSDVEREEPAFDNDPREQQDIEMHADEMKLAPSRVEEPDVINAVIKVGSGYEEELVFDPYAALQEPDGAGIVWDFASFSKHIEPVPTATAEEPLTEDLHALVADGETPNVEEIVEETSVDAESAAETSETVGNFPESSVDELEIQFDGGSILAAADQAVEDDQAVEFVQTVEVVAEELGAEEYSDDIQEVADPVVAEVETVDVAAEEIGDDVECCDEENSSITNDELILNRDEEQSEPESNAPEFVVEQAESEFADAACADDADENHHVVHNEHDVVQPVETRSLMPDRLADSVLPLLNELDNDLDSVARPAWATRSVLDIEAELIQTIEHGNRDLEDQIGAIMLDICLDTQSALQDSASAIRNAEAAELENIQEPDDTIGELHVEPFDVEPFDIVQPEPPCRDEVSGYQRDVRIPESDANGNVNSSSALEPESTPVEKPFGRLFSDLRRRKS